MSLLLETKRLILNATHPDDLKNYIQLYMDPDVRRLMYTRAKDENEVKRWLDAGISHQAQHGFSVGTVIEKSSGDFIGRAGLVYVPEDLETAEVEIDCFLLKPYWRKGYALELLLACFNWGFEKFNLDKIVAAVYPINIPSQQLALRAGMMQKENRIYKGVEFFWFEIGKAELGQQYG